MPAAEQLGKSTESEKSWSQVVEWMTDCAQRHPKCVRRHMSQDFVPTRLLDVGSLRSPWPPEAVRVVETAAEGIHAPYVTLSHCWGVKDFVRLKDDNLDLFTRQGVPWADMLTNHNFVDSVLIARAEIIHAERTGEAVQIRDVVAQLLRRRVRSEFA